MSEEKIRKTIITLAEAKRILKTIDPEKADQIQKRTIDYLEKFSKSEADTASRTKKELTEKCGLTDSEAAELVNIMPKTVDELRVFTSGWKKLLTTETVEKILKILHAKS
ncbi:MAG: RNA polymerase Rpb4 [Thaumarchaeota archaeon]|nr:RNA polymerase Rpb4 [Nitrososphaerota archaeon]